MMEQRAAPEREQLTPVQRATFTACFLGWSLDAFDFFILTYCVSSIAADFRVGVEDVTEALFWTLVMRPVGALLFGAMAEKFGRRPTLMVNIACCGLGRMSATMAPDEAATTQPTMGTSQTAVIDES